MCDKNKEKKREKNNNRKPERKTLLKRKSYVFTYK